MSSERKIHKCSLCDKSYKTEKGLINHKCKIRPKLQEMKQAYAIIAYNAFKVFFKKIQPTSKEKTYLDFAKSSYYDGFIKFGHFVHSIKMTDYIDYMNYLINFNVKLESWTNDKVYNTYIKQQAKVEKPDRAVEISINTMVKWSRKNNKKWQSYFVDEDKYNVLQCVRTGRISPWVLYNTQTGKMFMSKLTVQDLDNVYDLIDPSFWNNKFLREKNSVKTVSDILKDAGL